MIKNIRLLAFFAVIFSVFFTKVSAQLRQGQLVDGISAVIGNEIVLESDVQDEMNYARQQGINVSNRCDFMESLLNRKFIIHEAKQDTLIENRSAALKQQSEDKYRQILASFPNEKALLDTYKFRTAYEMKSMIERMDTDQYYFQQKFQRITEKTDITPNEVRDFYNLYGMQLEEIKDEVGISRIMVYPKLSDAHKDELKAKLNKMKQDIAAGESFEALARIYSEDPGSASNGGLISNVSPGRMVKPFEAAALNLQEGEISDPVETEYGYHIIQLVKKNGKMYDVRHVLLQSTPNAEEIEAAKKELDSIRGLIAAGKMTFKEAAFKYSDDKATKFNAGTMTSQEGVDRLEKMDLPPTLSYQIAGLNKGDMTDVYEDEDERKRKTVNLVKVNEIIPAHRIDIATDYERIKAIALNQKKQQNVGKWINERLGNTFISIDDRYRDCTFKTNWKKEALAK